MTIQKEPDSGPGSESGMTFLGGNDGKEPKSRCSIMFMLRQPEPACALAGMWICYYIHKQYVSVFWVFVSHKMHLPDRKGVPASIKTFPFVFAGKIVQKVQRL
ncbi:hypothetical protein [Desulfovermiculus halophilus]|jgi:hypothetical protein|uniref:hypothetical protein n=1 Tax=Desulfovermiculus halophilus TaxID=339722 RepID=UPI00047F063B|nr:hypothetical protein [Desulfovermiculus halophilus]